MDSEKISELEIKIGYRFKDISILSEAVTHSSYANECRQKNDGIKSNERLEFLGDSVLSILVSTYLFKKFPDLPEGELSRIRSGVICTAALSLYSEKLCLGDYLLLGKGEEKGGGRFNQKILENAFEAIVGAIYLDSGETLGRARKFTLPFIEEELKKTDMAGAFEDYKSELQQIIQQTPGEELSYVEIDKSGPDNAPVFTVEARLNSNVIGSGTGSSKKKAEQAAACDALKTFKK